MWIETAITEERVIYMEMGTTGEVWNCRIDTSGRIVIPQPVRAAKSLHAGDEISIVKVGDEFVMRTADETLEELLAAFRSKIPPGVSLVDELLEQRKAEAEREEAGR